MNELIIKKIEINICHSLPSQDQRPLSCDTNPVKFDHFSNAVAEATNAVLDDSISLFVTAKRKKKINLAFISESQSNLKKAVFDLKRSTKKAKN